LLLTLAACALLIGLPLAGIVLTGGDAASYLHFPPLPRKVTQPPFSWPVLLLLSSFVLLVVVPVARRVLVSCRRAAVRPRAGHLPGWGWAGIILTGLSWWLAWTRQPWFTLLQAYTFFPLWLGYIMTINGLAMFSHGRCLLADRPRTLLALFLASAPFWWFFEYLNRFVANWHYHGIEGFSSLGYVLHATLCFSTVLPAVASTADFLAGFSPCWQALAGRRPIGFSRRAGVAILAVAALGLFLVGILPTYSFPLVWLAPGAVIVGLQCATGRRTALHCLKTGDYRPVVIWPAAALLCGFFWEMWNMGSLAHWEYAIPFVDRFHLFYMPILGYAGYLPFGIECLVAVDLVDRWLSCPGTTNNVRRQGPRSGCGRGRHRARRSAWAAGWPPG